MKRKYLFQLSLWARWYLPTKEAAEVVEDYGELIEQQLRNEEDLRRNVGSPREAVRRLVQAKDYRRWLMVFGVLAACVLVPALMQLSPLYWSPILYFVRYAALIFGIALSFLWFRREGRQEKRLPKAVLLLFAVLLVGMAWAWFLAWAVLSESRTVIDFLFPPEWTPERNMSRGQLIQLTLILSVIAMILLSLFGLVKARLGDRRWRAAYVMALTGSLVVLTVYGIITMMSFYPGWQTAVALQLSFITILGLAGTAVSLC